MIESVKMSVQEYEHIQPACMINQENMYEVLDNKTRDLSTQDQPKEAPKKFDKHLNKQLDKQFIVLAVLLCLNFILLVAVLLLIVSTMFTKEDACVLNHEATSNINGCSNLTEWAIGVLSKVNSNVTGSLPDLNEWANGVVTKINSSVTGSIPDFNEWANGVVSKINSNVTGSLPDFSEWANGVVFKINSSVTGSLPDFSEWANGVVSKVNSNVTQSLPDFNEWANGVSQNTLQLFQSSPNFTELDKQILQTTKDSAQKLINIVNTLSNLQDTSASTGGVAVNTLLLINQMYPHLIPPLSCKQILSKIPNSPSGHYILTPNNGATNYSTYCDMGTLCDSGGGWTRLAYLDMSDPTQNCPSALELYQSGSVRACGRSLSNIPVGCASVQFPSNGISYSQICGRVTGYQHRSTDGPNTHIEDLNSYYVDGVSITRGSPRQHVWTLMAGNSETSSSSSNSCPCNNGSTVTVQSFVGDHYFCESGNKASTASNTLYTSDPLWDGQGCGSLESPCCNVTGIPWFHRDYGSNTTTDYIELRMCSDFDDEDTPVGYYEIYVK